KPVRITVTIDPGNVRTMTAPAGSNTRPVMTVTTESTAPIDTSDAFDDDLPDPTESPWTPRPQSPSPLPPKHPVKADWPKMKKVAPMGTGARLLTDRWSIRRDTLLLLSGQRPAFAIMV